MIGPGLRGEYFSFGVWKTPQHINLLHFLKLSCGNILFFSSIAYVQGLKSDLLNSFQLNDLWPVNLMKWLLLHDCCPSSMSLSQLFFGQNCWPWNFEQIIGCLQSYIFRTWYSGFHFIGIPHRWRNVFLWFTFSHLCGWILFLNCGVFICELQRVLCVCESSVSKMKILISSNFLGVCSRFRCLKNCLHITAHCC